MYHKHGFPIGMYQECGVGYSSRSWGEPNMETLSLSGPDLGQRATPTKKTTFHTI